MFHQCMRPTPTPPHPSNEPVWVANECHCAPPHPTPCQAKPKWKALRPSPTPPHPSNEPAWVANERHCAPPHPKPNPTERFCGPTPPTSSHAKPKWTSLRPTPTPPHPSNEPVWVANERHCAPPHPIPCQSQINVIAPQPTPPYTTRMVGGTSDLFYESQVTHRSRKWPRVASDRISESQATPLPDGNWQLYTPKPLYTGWCWDFSLQFSRHSSGNTKVCCY